MSRNITTTMGEEAVAAEATITGLVDDQSGLLADNDTLHILGNQTKLSPDDSNGSLYNLVINPGPTVDDSMSVTAEDLHQQHNERAIRSFIIVFSLAGVCLVLWFIYILLYHKKKVQDAFGNIVVAFKGHRGVKREHEGELPPHRNERHIRSTMILRKWFSKGSSLHDEHSDEENLELGGGGSRPATPALATGSTSEL